MRGSRCSRRLGFGLAVLAVVVAGLGASACGGEPTADDEETARAIAESSAATQRALQPLMLCVPTEPRCYAEAGPPLVRTVEGAKARFERVLAETDSDCLRGVAELYLRSLDAYLAAGNAAVAVDAAAVDAALSESTDHELAYLAKFDECGFGEGEVAAFGREFRRLNAEILRTSQELIECGGPACVDARASDLEIVADDAALLVSRARGDLWSPNSCHGSALGRMEDAYRLTADSARAILERRFGKADRLGRRASDLMIEAQESFTACFR